MALPVRVSIFLTLTRSQHCPDHSNIKRLHFSLRMPRDTIFVTTQIVTSLLLYETSQIVTSGFTCAPDT